MRRFAATTAAPARRGARPGWRATPPRARRPAPGPKPPRRPSPLHLLALALLGLFALVVGGGLLNAGLEALRGLSFARPSRPVAAQVERPDPLLAQRLQQRAQVPGGTVAVVARDLTSGATAAISAERPFASASLFKLPILVEVLKQQRLRRLSPDQPLQVQPHHWADGSGVLQARIGESLPVRELLRLMIQESDNIASLVLLEAVGAEQVNATMASMGLQQTRLRDRAGGERGVHVTSAADMARLLETIATGRLIDPETSEEALKLLESPQANGWLAESLPWWVKVAHKWGDFAPARHDAGIIYTPRRSYVLVVLTESSSPEAAREAIRGISREVYEHLGG